MIDCCIKGYIVAKHRMNSLLTKPKASKFHAYNIENIRNYLGQLFLIPNINIISPGMRKNMRKHLLFSCLKQTNLYENQVNIQ